MNITSYKLLDRFLCKVDNVSPGAVIARGEGPTRAAAEEDALSNARRRLQLTRVIADTRSSLEELQEQAPEELRAGVAALRDKLAEVETDPP
ncbi:MAG: hypothetical protein KC420_10650 [Myxococcales bacterium]|nr:hypothetical protein [Myxococcales bacterium]MCB9702119.1 hypothetical protein [Myxococcales bacterium]